MVVKAEAGFLFAVAAAITSSCFTSFAKGFPSVSALLCVSATPSSVAPPKEKFPGKINKNFPFCFSKLGTTTADRASWISFPLQVCCNREPGLRAEASGGKEGGCEDTGQSEGRTGTGTSTGGFFRFRLTRGRVEFFLALADVVAFGLELVLRLAATFRFEAADDFFLVVEEDAMIGYRATKMNAIEIGWLNGLLLLQGKQ